MEHDNKRDAGSSLRIALISIHGLIRGDDLELGRDPDTGGQTRYVVELARALGKRTEVAHVGLYTRRVLDPSLDNSYRRQVEPLAAKVDIVRIDCGPAEYIRKEELWDHLDTFVDNLISFWQEQKWFPDVIHSHYVDGGYAALRLSAQLGVPFVHTGHSLGRVKRARLLASGLDMSEIEERYLISRRIDAEENILSVADRVIVSTQNEIDKQYGMYELSDPERMLVIPPGTDLNRFRPPDGTEVDTPLFRELSRFLRSPQKPIILALSRPDERKNIGTLIDAYGSSKQLQKEANLVVVAGNRDDISEMEPATARVLTGLLVRIDAHDLYGRVAFPKHHGSEDIPLLYRLAASLHGVFVNPALTEPFGLTLIEAAASGLPVVATEDGGPRDIIENCRNGYLIDPLDPDEMAATLLEVLRSGDRWNIMASKGLRGVQQHYSWPAHADRYLEEIEPLVRQFEPRPRPKLQRRPMLFQDRALFTDIDQNLIGDPESLEEFVAIMRRNRPQATFGIATGRALEPALQILRKHGIPRPDVLITSVGTAIHYGPAMTQDRAWSRHIDHLWTPERIREVLGEVPGLELQPKDAQTRFKVSCYYDPASAPPAEEILRRLRQEDQMVNVFLSFGEYLDVVPERASKGFALRWFAEHWDIPVNRILAAGGSGADEDMMRGNTLAAVVGHRHHEDLSDLVEVDRIYFADKPYAAGILEAIEHYDFYGECRAPDSSS